MILVSIIPRFMLSAATTFNGFTTRVHLRIADGTTTIVC
jgi:hypothetical protein